MGSDRIRGLRVVIANCLAIGLLLSGAGMFGGAARAAVFNSQTAQSSSGVAVGATPDDGHQYVFWRAAGGQVYEAWYDSSWHGPVRMGWTSAAAPSVTVSESGHQCVFWQDANQHISEACFYRSWSRPRDLTALHRWGQPGRSSSGVTAAVNPANGHQYVFWRAVDGNIYEAWYDHSWHGPVNMGWSSAAAPSVAVSSAGHQYVVWQGTNQHIYEAWNYGSWSRPWDLTARNRWGQSGLSSLGVTVAVNPSNEHQYVFWRGAGGQVYEAWYDSSWHGPVNLGWISAPTPSVAVSGAEHLYAFWRIDRQIWEASYNTAWGGPVRRWHVNPGIGAYVEVVQTTGDLAQRLRPLSNLQFRTQPPSNLPTIAVDDSVRYQHVTGVGAAMTDSAAWLIYQQLSPATRAVLMNDLFGTSGIRLGFTVVPMGASDFTQNGQPYTYDDMPTGQTDPQLANFSIAHDERYIIPALRQMLALNPQAEVFAVPWSPPAWMKANGALDDINYHGTLLASAYPALADYFVKFVQAYARDGVPISAIAPENEPNVRPDYPSMYFPPASEAQWIAQDLKPALDAAHLQPKIYGADTDWATASYPQVLISSQARNALTGIAWHCYGGIPSVMSTLQSVDPTLDQLVTECSPNLIRYPIPEILIGAMRNWASAVTLWNLALDPSGGPVQPPNTGCQSCTGIVTIDARAHTFTRNLDYYQLGQVGAFVQPGATRISSNTFVSFYQQSPTNFGATPRLDDVAFLNPDGSRVLVAYNNSPAAVGFSVNWSGRAFTYSLAPRATVTFRWRLGP